MSQTSTYSGNFKKKNLNKKENMEKGKKENMEKGKKEKRYMGKKINTIF